MACRMVVCAARDGAEHMACEEQDYSMDLRVAKWPMPQAFAS
jgi:hypothetical protein